MTDTELRDAALAELKRCPACLESKPLAQFTLNKNCKGGRWVYCKPCSGAQQRRRYHANRDFILQRQRVKGKSYRDSLRAKAVAAYGGECDCCGEAQLEFLSFDHVEGGGKRHRAEIGGSGQQFYRWLRDNGYPDGVRLLCHNCNQSLGLYGYCPHRVSAEVAA